ncbi:uncharacterized protein LOC134577461 [Pelobates fuscus]|uniref:uncharacterized protein LOC134577461 n=1 Tax=Pelobates fuscus TaxID=191477 RepID=UPI002FE4D6B7
MESAWIQFDVSSNTVRYKTTTIQFDDASNTVRYEDELDAFRLYTPSTPKPRSFRNYHHRILIAITDINEESSCAHFESYADYNDTHAKFFLHKYRQTGPHHNGTPIIFTLEKDSKNYIMYCTNDNSIHFKVKELPKEIPLIKSKYIFYQKTFSPGQSCICFESSLKRDFYLSFLKENYVQKLILKHCPLGKFDETIKMYSSDPNL